MSKRRRKRPLPQPCAHAEVESLSHDGRGVTHLDGKAVFIDGALPGEVVSLEYLAVHQAHDEARVIEVLQPSPDRVTPKCPHFGSCGGCSLQHMDAAAQIIAKQRTLLDNLKHLGKVVPETVLPPLTGPVWGYRTRGRLGVKYVQKKGRVLVGFREKRCSLVADLGRCEVMHPALGEHLRELALMIDQLQGRARLPQIEFAVTDSITALVFRHLEPFTADDLDKLKQFAVDRALHVYLQSGGPDTVRLLWPEQADLAYHLPAEGIEIRFRPTDFTQVNAAINQDMVARVVAMLAPRPTDRVLDLFCGLGNFTLPLARHAGQVTGVEGDAGLVDRARANARLNGIDNVSFYSADLAQETTGAAWAGAHYDQLMLDPPRSGAAAVLDIMGNMHPQRIVYVSCHPGSLARDAGILVNAKGYRLLAAGVMDMFPHTAHVESIALFEAEN